MLGTRTARSRWIWSAVALGGLLAACSGEGEPPPEDRCAQVTCAVAGTSCDAADGQCKCGGPAGPVCGEGQTCDAAAMACAEPVPDKCTGGATYAAGMTAFREVTEAWGLAALAVQGTRIAAQDFDGDGRADLFVRAGGNGVDEWGATRRSWLLRNTGAGFEDVTQSSGVRQTRVNDSGVGRPGEVVAFADVDNDGDIDVFTGMTTGVDGALEGETSELMLNQGDGTFALGPEASALRRAGEPDIVAGVSFVDFDRDGHVDVWVGQHNYQPAGSTQTIFKQDYLYKGHGDGTFTDVTAQVGLTTEDWRGVDDLNSGRAHSRAWSTAACDLDGDGTTEVLAASYGRAPNHLWRGLWIGDGTVGFDNQSVASGYAYDADLTWTDNEFAKCYCQKYPAAEGCDQAGAPRVQCPARPEDGWTHSQDREAFRLGGNSGTTVCADVNNDGRMDLLTTEITHWWAGAGADQSELLLNTGEADLRFERPGGQLTGLTRWRSGVSWDQGDMTAAVFDFDNDGWPDIYLGASDYPGNRGLLYHQVAPGMFEEVPVEDGVEHNRSHGVAWADFDRDGDLDLVVGHSRARCDANAAYDCYETRQVRMFENLLGDQGNWIQLDLVGGPGTNRAAIGARVSVAAGDVTQTQEVGGGHGHYGIQNSRVLHFGLGAACEAQVTIRWPNAALSTQQVTLKTGFRYRIVQGEAPERVEP